MDVRHFDALTRAVSAATSRRSLLGVLALLPLVRGAFAHNQPQGAVASAHHRHGKRRHKRGHGKGNTCHPKPLTQICAGRCGTVTNSLSCGVAVDCGTTCPDPNTTCCGGLCQTQAELNAACPATNTLGYLTFPNGSRRCASLQVEACTCLGGLFANCRTGTVCKAFVNGVLCDFPGAS